MFPNSAVELYTVPYTLERVSFYLNPTIIKKYVKRSSQMTQLVRAGALSTTRLPVQCPTWDSGGR